MFKNLFDLFSRNSEITSKYSIRFLFILSFSVLIALLELVSISLLIPIITILSSNELNNIDNSSLIIFLEKLLKFSSSDINYLIFIFVLTLLITAIGRIYLTYAMRVMTNKVGNDLAIKLFCKATGDDYSYHLKVNKTKIISLFNKIDYLMDGVLSPVFLSLSSIIITFLMIAFLVFIDTKLAILSMGSIALIYISISKVVNSKLIKNSEIISNLQNKNLSVISSSINNVKSLIINQSSAVFQKEFELIDFNRRMAMARNNVIGIIPKYLVEALSLTAILLIALYQLNVESNSNSIPYIASILFAFQKMLPMVQAIYQSWTQIKGSDGVIKDVKNALDIELENPSVLPNRKDSSEVSSFGNIILKDISFRYGKREPKVLNKINLKISRGEKIAIIGNSGAGKTTLVEVLLSLLNYTDGEILWDGVRISQSNLHKYRSLFSYVSQDVFLIEDTLEKNIAFTLDEKLIDHKYLWDSISKSNLFEFVNGLPFKEKTVVGELRLLSGGQKQRIGIARALYHNPKILILDESTSNLDPQTEIEILKSLTQNNPDLSIIMITHKYDNLNLFDNTYRMSNGLISLI